MKNFFEETYLEALKAFKKDEVPVGALIIKNDKIIAKAHNLKEHKKQPMAHAEILAISKACKKLKSWRLDDCTMIVSLEPCPMCAGAIASARIKELIYLAKDNSGINKELCKTILSDTRVNHKVILTYVNMQECSSLITKFFKQKRK